MDGKEEGREEEGWGWRGGREGRTHYQFCLQPPREVEPGGGSCWRWEVSGGPPARRGAHAGKQGAPARPLPQQPRGSAAPLTCLSWNSVRKRVMRSEGMAKEMPAATFSVLMPMTSPSWAGQSEGHHWGGGPQHPVCTRPAPGFQGPPGRHCLLLGGSWGIQKPSWEALQGSPPTPPSTPGPLSPSAPQAVPTEEEHTSTSTASQEAGARTGGDDAYGPGASLPSS